MNAQILLNILRARDRQPRYYLSTTGISDAPLISDDRTISLSGIGLGNGFANWAIGSGSLKRETSRRPSYAVQPLGADTLAKAVFQPTPHNVFARYWNSGWPRDMLVMLMVDRITRVENGRASTFDNEANNVSADCTPAVETSGCAFVREARTLLGAMNQIAAPLFRILPQGAANEAARGKPRQDFAASVHYAGQRYYAGQAVGRACADAAPDGLCKDDASNGDRSSSVLSLLAELLALNQSPDSIRAPGRVFTE